MIANLKKRALILSSAAFLYIVGIAEFMSHGEALLGKTDTIFTVVIVLLLFVISAAVMGLLIFGRPAMMYLDGNKKEALQLLFYTIGFLVTIAVVFLIILILLK